MPDNGLNINLTGPVENIQLPDPSLLTYYRNLEDRVLWLDTEVDETWLEFIRNIVNWNKEDSGVDIEDRKPIKLMLYSYGGDLDINNAFIDVIRSSRTPVWAINVGQSCSAACFISVACHKRFAFKHSSYLIHQGGGHFEGDYRQIISAVSEYQRKIEYLAGYLLESTTIPEDVLMENIIDEWYVTAEDALKWGICDKIVDSIEEIL